MDVQSSSRAFSPGGRCSCSRVDIVRAAQNPSRPPVTACVNAT